MDSPTKGGQYAVKGGRTIIGRLFAYQEKTGMAFNEILKIPYIVFVLGMLDAPSIDYDTKKETTIKPKTAEEEVNAVVGFLG